ncbi:TonB-dependent siderophore receptor [Pseudomonas sp. abacavir_1]
MRQVVSSALLLSLSALPLAIQAAAKDDRVDLGATEVLGTQDPAAAATTEGSGSYTTKAMRTSTKIPMSIRETPQSVSVVTRQRMDDQGMNDLNDAVKGVTGLTVQQYGPARVSYASRGFDVDNIMYDGLPTSISTYTQDVISAADLAMFDRVEVVRGATGLMQGAGNPAAAINMVRKRPTQDFHMSLEGSAGTWDRYRSEADVSGPLNSEGTLRGRAVMAYQTKDSFQDYVSSERGVLYGITEADLSPDTTLAIGASYQDDNRNDNWVGLPAPLGGRHLDLKRSDYYGADWSYWDTKTTHLFSDLTHRFDNGWQMKLAADKLWARINMLGLYNSCYYTQDCPTMTQGAGKYDYTDDHESYDAFANGPFQLLGREHELVVGASYRQERFDGHGGWGDLFKKDGTPLGAMDPTQWDPASTLKPNIDMNLWGMKLDQEQKGTYVTTRLNIADPLKVILGGRLDWYEADAHGDTDVFKVTRKVTRYAGVIYDLNDTYSVYASYTDIFKPQDTLDATGNVLTPITGKNYEIGLKGEHFGGALNSQIALFQVDQENRATDDTSSPNPCPANPSSFDYCQRASGKVRSQGVDMELSGELSQGWQAMVGYTYVDAKYKHDADESNVGKPFDSSKPRHLFKLATTYNLPGDLHKWRVGGNLTTQSQTEDTTTGFQQGGYTVVDAMLGYRVSENIDTRVNFNNIFDKYYYSGISFGNLNYGEPRNLMFSVKYSM